MSERQGILDVLFPSIERNRQSRERRELENKLLRDSMAAMDQTVDLLGRDVNISMPTRRPGQQIPAVVPQNPNQIGMPALNLPGKDPIYRDVPVPEVNTPQGRRKLMQLMARMSPEGAMKVGESLIPGSTQRTSAIIGDMDALGLPRTMENYQRIAATKGGSSDPIEMALAAALLQQREQQNQTAAREEAAATEQQRVDRLTRQSSLNSTLRGIEDLATNNQFLSSTFMRPGWGAETRRTGLSAWEFLKSVAGGDTSKERLLLQTYGDFEKGAANLLNDLLPTLRGINANTDNRLDQIKKSLADVGNEPGTNAKILSETIYDILDIAEINRLEIPQIETWRGLAENLRYFNKSGGALYQEGETATNPETGEQLIFHNGGWKRPDEIRNQR